MSSDSTKTLTPDDTPRTFEAALSTVIRAIIGLITLIAAIRVLTLVHNAWIFPMELEVREGALWLHVLALQSGVSIYDHLQVAFVSHHGPIDHLLKCAVFELFPSLSSQMVTRIFVATLPFSLFFMMYQITQALSNQMERICLSILLGLSVYLGMMGLGTYNLLVGRTDPLSLSLLALQGGLTADFVINRRWSWWKLLVYGLLIALNFFSIWRSLPITGSMALLTLLAISNGQWRRALMISAIFLVVPLVALLLLLKFMFLGDATSFYQHTYGIFLDPKFTTIKLHQPFQLFPDELWASPSIWLPILAPLLGLAALNVARVLRKQFDLEIVTAFFLVLICYVLHAYGFNSNRSAGGFYYFNAYILLAWFAWALYWPAALLNSRIWRRVLLLIMAVYILVVPDWAQVHDQNENLQTNYAAALKFRMLLEDLDQKGLINSETAFFYKHTLGNSRIDNGDGVEDLLGYNYFDQAFRKTAEASFALNRGGHYPYFLIAGVESPGTLEYLKRNYDVVSVISSYATWNSVGGCVSSLNCVRLVKKRE